MKKYFFVVVVLLTTSSCLFGQKKIELIDLIKMFLPVSTNSIPEWTTGADEKSPIEWITEGTNWLDEKDYNYDLGAFMREGKVVVTIDKEPLYVLKKKKEVEPWIIKLYGPRIGISAIYLYNELISPSNCFEPICLEKYFSKRNIKVRMLKRDKGGMESDGSRLYEIKISNKILFLLTEYSEGSAGITGSLIFFIDEPNQKVLLKRNIK